MKKFYSIFVVNEICINRDPEGYSYLNEYSYEETLIPYTGELFETEEEAEKYLEVALNDNENIYKHCQFTIQKVYVRDNYKSF